MTEASRGTTRPRVPGATLLFGPLACLWPPGRPPAAPAPPPLPPSPATEVGTPEPVDGSTLGMGRWPGPLLFDAEGVGEGAGDDELQMMSRMQPWPDWFRWSSCACWAWAGRFSAADARPPPVSPAAATASRAATASDRPNWSDQLDWPEGRLDRWPEGCLDRRGRPCRGSLSPQSARRGSLSPRPG